MNKQLQQASKQIGKAFDNYIKDSEIGAIFIGVAPDGTLSIAYNGTPEQQYTAIAHFLFEHPEHIELFQASVDCATEFHSKKPTSKNQYLN
jgi:hypothetical protein